MNTQHNSLIETLCENARASFEQLNHATSIGVAFVLATIASLCGIPGGQWKLVRREEITQQVMDDLAYVIANGWGRQGESDQLKTLARRSTAGMVKQALKQWSLSASKVGISYLEAGNSGESKYPPQYDPQHGDGLRVGVAITLPETKEGNPLPDPTGTPEEIRQQQEDRDAVAKQERATQLEAQRNEDVRFAEAVKVATANATALVASLAATDGTADLAIGSLMADLASNPQALAEAWADRISDETLVRLAKVRGFTIRRKVAS